MPTHHPFTSDTSATRADIAPLRGDFGTHAGCPFTERFGRRMPADFAELADGLSWRELVGAFAPARHHFHLVDFHSRYAGRGVHTYEALIAVPASDDETRVDTHRLTTRSCGDFSAMSEMLAALGAHVEVERLHQYSSDGTWCTILHSTDGARRRWAMGFGATSAEANVRALLSAASLTFLR